MPLKLNVGLARKVGEANYSSRGASVNLETELDAGLVGDPVKLHDRIRQLFALVRTALAEELNGNGHAPVPANGHSESAKPANTIPKATPGHEPGRDRSATPAQVKAIYAIARSRQLDMARLLHEHHGVSRPDALTIPEASRFIDFLKNTPPPSGDQ
jgi:hypothetical protein